MKIRAFLLTLTLFLAILISIGCASARKPVPPGVVPPLSTVRSEDEAYGLKVLSELARQYPLDRDDYKIARVRSIVDRLASAARADHSPWNVYVFKARRVKNAAATRGNFIFVWSGMFSSVRNDDELATILAHEIGHVLARHTMADPSEEAGQIIAGGAGSITNGVIAAQGGTGYSILGQVGEAVIKAAIAALIVNPEQQRKELEADTIGFFLMADAGYDPRSALELGSNTLVFLSTHPSSKQRLENLQKLLPDAMDRFERALARRAEERRRSLGAYR